MVASFVPCPPMCLFGVLFGGLALRDIRRTGRRGRGASIVAIAVGLAVTVLWIVLAVWWNANIRRPLIDGPVAAFRLGLAGDVEGFRDAFLDPGTPAETRAFLAEMTERYGPLRTITPETRGPAHAAKDIDPALLVVPYLFGFDGRSVPGEARFVPFDDGRLALEWGWVRIGSPDDALTYPASAMPPPAPAETN